MWRWGFCSDLHAENGDRRLVSSSCHRSLSKNKNPQNHKMTHWRPAGGKENNVTVCFCSWYEEDTSYYVRTTDTSDLSEIPPTFRRPSGSRASWRVLKFAWQRSVHRRDQDPHDGVLSVVWQPNSRSRKSEGTLSVNISAKLAARIF